MIQVHDPAPCFARGTSIVRPTATHRRRADCGARTAVAAVFKSRFSETLRRALIGMFATLVIGLVVGGMAQKMLDENAKQLEKKTEISETKIEPKGR